MASQRLRRWPAIEPELRAPIVLRRTEYSHQHGRKQAAASVQDTEQQQPADGRASTHNLSLSLSSLPVQALSLSRHWSPGR